MDWGQLLETIIYGVIFIATGVLMKWFPPKNINRFTVIVQGVACQAQKYGNSPIKQVLPYLPIWEFYYCFLVYWFIYGYLKRQILLLFSPCFYTELVVSTIVKDC
ncbi:hypothetical protein SAMN04488514_105228 [Kriegella aquimaris]|uniref:Uncharacterized protein n=1 Tax=Kriegella aquimaris TaxID=192904 RepID=A0A1G9QVP0_9FLAO|nr:hypothetical protein SAMN04488514_105228 [Kriegella aquimaris]